MIDAVWFHYEGSWHIHAEGATALCNLELLEAPPLVTPGPEDPPPPNPCRKCILQWGMTFVEDEPLEDAIARGYLPVDPLPVDFEP